MVLHFGENRLRLWKVSSLGSYDSVFGKLQRWGWISKNQSLSILQVYITM